MEREPDDLITTDLLVIGGGINGTGIARDAAGRGLKVFLCEKDDLAQHTSSASTKLIHGGLRYLEHYDFKLVRHALLEREVLLRSAPHVIWPLRFILPHHKRLRPKWLIRLGLFLYDHIGGKMLLPHSRSVDLRQHAAGASLKSLFDSGFEYSDCWVQDARLVVLTAMDAELRGATIRTRTVCVSLERHQKHWIATLHEQGTGNSYRVKARSLVNAGGPWVKHVLDLYDDKSTSHRVRLVKGSHIVVPQLFDHEYPYIFQNADGRVLFAIPFERDFTLLGTTDLEVGEIPEKSEISPEECRYICGVVSEYLNVPVHPDDVVWSYSGVRPLHDDAAKNASNVTRDYYLEMDTEAAPIVSVFGGKITTYRRLSEEVIDLLAKPMSVDQVGWTVTARLPGGDIANADFDRFLEECSGRYSWMPEDLLWDYARNYGTRISRILNGCSAIENLGKHFGGLLYEREVVYLMENEYARTSEDVLWRRTKKGLNVSSEVAGELDRWMVQHRPISDTGKLSHS